MRIAVTGGREYSDRDRVFSVLYSIAKCTEDNPLPVDFILIVGDAPGLDSIAEDWGVVNWVTIEKFEADWHNLKAKPCVVKVDANGRPYNVLAGPNRNQRMIDEGKPELLVAFPGGTGTADMVRRCRKVGIPVKVIT